MKKTLSWILVLALLLGMMPVHIFAAEGTETVQESAAMDTFIGTDALVTAIRQAMVQRQRSIRLRLNGTALTSSEVSELVRQAEAHTGVPNEGDYIRANMLGYSSSVTTGEDAGGVYSIVTIECNFISDADMEAEVDAAVEELLGSLNLWSASNYDKIKGVYDWITSNVDYDYEWDDLEDDTGHYKHTTHAALIAKTAVCQGIASLYYRLMLELGVDCRYISGISTDITGSERHAWNIVCLEGKYYNCDPTWDCGLTNYYRQFLCTQANFSEHTRDAEYDTSQFHAQYPMAVTPYVRNVTASGQVNANIAWVLDGDTGTLTVAGTGIIPSYRFSHAPWYDYRESIQKIVISEGITEVGERAFYWSTNCTEVVLPDSLVAIREYGFNNLRNLQYITLPPNLKIIEFCAFSECVALVSITLPDSVTTVESNAFSNCYKLTSAVLSAGMKTIPSSMFGGDSSLRSVKLPEGITYIDDTAFINCGFSSFTLPASVTGLGTAVFSGCTSLSAFYVEEGNTVYKAVDGVLFSADGTHLICYPSAKFADYGNYTVPEGTRYIDYGAFRSARYLYGVHFPSTLLEIGGYSFSYCKNLYSVTFPSNIITIEEDAFRSCTGLYEVTFKNPNVDLVGYTFASCTSLRSITLPANLRQIPNGLFYGCTNLQSITIPSTVTRIGSSAFLDCDGLRTITIPGTVKSIGQQAFDFCNKLETITFQEGVQTLGWICIRNAPKLKTVFIPSSVTKIEQPYNTDSYTFDDCPNAVLYVNCGSYGHRYAMSRGLNYQASHTVVTEDVPPTCTQSGYTHYYCSCGNNDYISNYRDALGHAWGAWETTMEPTCTAAGSKRRECSRCGYVEISEIPAVGHSYDDWTVTKAATCTEDGEERRDCVNCDHYEARTVTATGHDYESVVTPPTCTERGYTTYTCNICGESYVDDYVDAIWHNYEDEKCGMCGCDMLRIEQDDIIRYQGGVNSENGTLQTSFTNNWYTDIRIPTGAKQVRILTFKTGGRWGSAFFNGTTFISGICDPTVGGQWITVDIPEDATMFRYGYLYDQIAQNNNIPAFTHIEFTGAELSGGEETQFAPRPETGCHSFRVEVNIAPAKGDPNGFEAGTDYGYIMLPPNYSPYDEPTRLIIVCHGAGAVLSSYQSDAWKTHNYSFWTDLGYAIMDMYACPTELSGSSTELHFGNPTVLECYQKGYDYVMERFNLKKDGVFVIGSSMGGLSSFQLVQSGAFPVLAQVGYCPVIDLYKQAYCNPWASASYQRASIAGYFGFVGEKPTFSDSKFPTQEEMDYFRANHAKVVGYSPILSGVISGDSAVLYGAVPSDPLSVDEPVEAALYSKLTAMHPCPIMIFHNLDDQTVSYRYSKYFKEMVERSGQEVILHTFLTGGHNAWDNGPITNVQGLNGSIALSESKYEAYKFFQRFESHDEHTPWLDPAVEPSCVKEGRTEGKHCSVCGEILLAQQVISATGHKHDAVVTAPTCTEKGYTTYTCACGHSFVDSYVDAMGHKFGDWTVTKAATCTEDGQERRDCANCDHYEIRTVTATGHDYESVVTPPTCTERGYTTYTCACGDSYVDSYVEATGHTAVTDTALQPTSAKTGLTEGSHCEICGTVLVTQNVIPARGYDWMLEDGEFKILLIGNSFSEDASNAGMPNSQMLDIFQAMLGEDVKITVGLCYSGGKGLNWHATQSEQGNSSYSLRVISSESGAWKSYGAYSSSNALAWTDWDVVSLQHYEINTTTGKESNAYPDQVDPKFDNLEAATEFMLDYVDEHAPDAAVYFYMHWARAYKSNLNESLSTYNKMAGFFPVVLDYTGTESANRFETIIPVGLSVQNARTTYLSLLSYNTTAYADGNLNLTTDAQIGLQRDGGHLSYNVGRYIAGLTFAETIIPAELRAEGYELPDIRITESVGKLPKEYTVIAQKSVWAAVESWKRGDLGVTNIEGYTVDPTVTAARLLAQTSVAVCGATEQTVRESVLALLPADFAVDAVTITGEATCNVTIRFGYTSVTVSVNLAEADHTYDSAVTAPTCTEKGYTTHTCAKCGDSYEDSYVEATGHSWGDWEVVKEPTAQESGLRQRTCAVCGEAEREEIPKLEIVYGDANDDGGVNALDLILLRQYLAGWDVTISSAADANGDGTANALDLILLRQYLAGWDVTLGPKE